MRSLLIPIALVCLLLAGCGTGPENPSFSLSVEDARIELKSMEATPRRLDRPVVVIGGYMDIGIGPEVFAKQLRDATGDDRIIAVSLFWCPSFDACRDHVLAAVDKAFPSTDPAHTTEVDVVGISMGGLAARYSALPVRYSPTAAADRVDRPIFAADLSPATQPTTDSSAAPGERTLRIARLFTLATPHQGAVLADLPTIIPTQRAMRRGSDFITWLNAAKPAHPFPIIPYTRVPDSFVGSNQTAPPDQTPIWVGIGPLHESHVGIMLDPRVSADVSRRLRNEPAYAADEHRAPLPE